MELCVELYKIQIIACWNMFSLINKTWANDNFGEIQN